MFASEVEQRLFSKNRVVCIVVFSWMVAPLFLLPFFFFSKGGFGWRSTVTLCVFLTSDYTKEELNYMQVIYSAVSLMDLGVIVSSIISCVSCNVSKTS